jgi:hypothetical protein
MRLKKAFPVMAALILLCGTAGTGFSQEPGDFLCLQDRRGGLTITGYTGSGRDIAVPASIGGLRVTAVGNKAFRGLGLTSVTLPEGIESIGVLAFADNSITTLVLPAGLRIIETGAFSANRIERLEIPDSVTIIRYNAFGRNPIRDLKLSANVRAVNPRAFTRSRLDRIALGRDVDIYIENFERGFVNRYESGERQAGSYVKREGVWVREEGGS